MLESFNGTKKDGTAFVVFYEAEGKKWREYACADGIEHARAISDEGRALVAERYGLHTSLGPGIVDDHSPKELSEYSRTPREPIDYDALLHLDGSEEAA